MANIKKLEEFISEDYKSNQFNQLILENKQQAKSILRKKGIQKDNPDYIKIKDLTESTPNYLGMFTKYRFEQKISFDELEDLHKWLVGSNWVDKLPKQVLQYSEHEDLKDDIVDLEVQRKSGKIYQELPSFLKSIVKEQSQENKQDFDIMSSKIYDIKNYSAFTAKISAVKTFDELMDKMEDFVELNEGTTTYIDIKQQIQETTGAKLEFEDEDEGILLASINSFNASSSLGSKNWCISTGLGSWNSYVGNQTTRKQYFLWNFRYTFLDNLFMIGMTVDKDGDFKYVQDMLDKNIMSDIPEEIIELKSKDLLNGPTKQEIEERLRQKSLSRKEFYRENPGVLDKALVFLAWLKEEGMWYFDDEDDEEFDEELEEDELDEEEKNIEKVSFIEPIDYDFYGMPQFGFEGSEYAIGTDEEADAAYNQYQESLWDEMGIDSFNSSFIQPYIERHIDGDSVAEYLAHDIEERIRESPESYFSEEELELSEETKKEIEKLMDENTALEEEKYSLEDEKESIEDEDRIDEIDERISEIDERIDEITDEIYDLENDEDNKEPTEEMIDEKAEETRQEYRDNAWSYLEDFGMTDNMDSLKQFIDMDALKEEVTKDAKDIDGRGHSLNSYDGTEHEFKNEEDDTWYYIYQTN